MPLKKTIETDSGIRIEEINYSFAEHLDKRASLLPENYTLLLLVEAEDYSNVILGIAEKYVVNDKKNGVFLTANKQSRQLNELFSKSFSEFDLKKIFFLDCASKQLQNPSNGTAVICNPQNLIDLNIAINQTLEMLPPGGFLVVDSISTLLIYNDERVLKKFVKAVVEKCYAKKANGIFLCSNSKSTKDFVEDIKPFFDETINTEKM